MDRAPYARAPYALLGLLAAVLAAATVGGLRLQDRGSPPEPAPAPAAAPAGIDLTATLELPRLVREPRTVGILVTNHGPAPVWVGEVELVTDSFAPTGPVPKDVVVPAGLARSLHISYGRARCGGVAAPAAAPAFARLVVAAVAGAPGAGAPAADRQELELALPHPNQQLAQRLHTECAAALVDRAVEIRLGGWSALPDGRLRGDLVVERRGGDQPVTVHDLAGSVLYRLASDRPAPVGMLPPGRGRLEIPVLADAARCDAHAKADAKQPFGFRTWVSVGGAERLAAAIATDPAGQRRLDQLWHDRCGV